MLSSNFVQQQRQNIESTCEIAAFADDDLISQLHTADNCKAVVKSMINHDKNMHFVASKIKARHLFQPKCALVQLTTFPEKHKKLDVTLGGE